MVRKKKHPQSRAERLAINELKKKKRPIKKEVVQQQFEENCNEEPRIYVVEEAVGGVADRVPSS